MSLASSVNQSRQLPLGVAYNRCFYIGVAGLTLTVTLSKNGGSFGAIAGAITEVGLGWYKAALTSADTGTQGDLAFHATDGGTNIEDWSDQVAGYVTLADKVSHGGSLGSSIATFALDRAQWSSSTSAPGFLVTSSLGSAVLFEAISNGDGLSLIGQGVGNYDFGLRNTGTFWNAGANKPVDMRLADATDHGGTPGASTATIAFDHLIGQSSTNHVFRLNATGTSHSAMSLNTSGATSPVISLSAGDYSSAGILVNGGGIAIDLFSYADNSNPGIGIRVTTEQDGTGQSVDGIVVIAAAGGVDINLAGSHSILGYLAGNATPTFIGPGARVQLDMTQAVPTSNTPETVGDALIGSRANAFGVWKIDPIAFTLTIYAADGTTPLRVFTLDSITSPLQRV